jgi:hypothetical protein
VISSDGDPDLNASSWDVAVATGLVRIAAGSLLLRRPGLLASLAGARSDDRLVRAVVAGLGVRDLALGVSALAATRPGGDVRAQLRLQAAADAVDAVIVAAAMPSGRLPRGRAIAGVLIALTSAGGHLRLSGALRR